jgi:hypothetical protein
MLRNCTLLCVIFFFYARESYTAVLFCIIIIPWKKDEKKIQSGVADSGLLFVDDAN